jgi:uncharacterized membrane protein SpoIIM required for sporulation
VTEPEFASRRGPAWREVEDALLERDGRKSLRDPLAVARFPRLYRELCRDLNRARAEHYSLELQEKLNRLILNARLLLYRAPRPDPAGSIARGAAAGPAAVRRLRSVVLICAAAFYGAAAIAFGWAYGDRDKAVLLLGEGTVSSLESMYDPGSEHFLKPRDVTNDADMFGFYISNNIGIGFGTMAGGLLAGIGSVVVLVFNGAFLGAAAAAMVAAGYGKTFFPFVCGHSAFELTSLILFASAGFTLGRSLIAPGRSSRYEALRRSGAEAFPVAGLAFAFMAAAAGIESFWSARPAEAIVKYAVAGVLWLSVSAYLAFGGAKRAR